jgi:biopolymer transport protein ExbB/TolQ
VVAIPAVLAFNYLSARSDAMMMAIDQARGQLVDHLEAHPGSQEHINARAA